MRAPPPSPAPAPPKRRRRRVPAFVPVPTRARSDGWTVERQAAFIAHLSAHRSVLAAASHAGMSRESAYRLRARPGAESFAAAWDAILHNHGQPAPRKVTPQELWHRAIAGQLQPVLNRRVHMGNHWKPDNYALLRLLHRYRAHTASHAVSQRQPTPLNTAKPHTLPASAQPAAILAAHQTPRHPQARPQPSRPAGRIPHNSSDAARSPRDTSAPPAMLRQNPPEDAPCA